MSRRAAVHGKGGGGAVTKLEIVPQLTGADEHVWVSWVVVALTVDLGEAELSVTREICVAFPLHIYAICANIFALDAFWKVFTLTRHSTATNAFYLWQRGGAATSRHFSAFERDCLDII